MTEERLGAQDACPHCGAHAGITADGAEYRCLVCGGPRIVVDTPLARPGGEKPHLERAKSLRTARAVWAVGGSVVGAFGLLSLGTALLVAWIAQTGALASAAMAVLAAVPLVLGLYAWRKAQRLSRDAKAEMARARRVAASELIALRSGHMDPPELARILRLSEDEALELIAESQVDRFLSEGPAGPRYRVVTGDEAAEAVDTEAPTTAQPIVRR